jgi:hypothetical protein
MKYVDSKVWLKVPGGVEGWDVDELNSRIDEWNSPSNSLVRSLGDFFQWLSYVEERPIYGFSVLWHSKQLSNLHRIKEA